MAAVEHHDAALDQFFGHAHADRLHFQRLDAAEEGHRAPERVAVPDTKPGQTVNVSVTIATPNEQATCFGRWMQTDSEGNFTFPEQRPYYYTFKVE